VWELYTLRGYTQEEVANMLGVSRRTICRDLKYIKEHPECIPAPDDEDLVKYAKRKLVRLLEEGDVPDRKKIDVCKDIVTSQMARRIKKEEAITIAWGIPDEEDNPKE